MTIQISKNSIDGDQESRLLAPSIDRHFSFVLIKIHIAVIMSATKRKQQIN